MRGSFEGRPISRRRAIVIAAGLAAAPWLAMRPARSELYQWTGTALGAPASILLHHRDRAVAEKAVNAAVDEIERLENEFSLYRPESAICRLNRDGRHARPSHDMCRLLTKSCSFGDLTEGWFDVTVQPLWELYARHFVAAPGDNGGPPQEAIDLALSRIDYRRIQITGEAIELWNGAKVTLNGIAQGYITDRVADLLRRQGWTNVLIDLGEIRGLGRHPQGRPWQVGLRNASLLSLDLEEGALATSAWNGTVFDRQQRFGHLFDPRRGAVRTDYRSITVAARDATTADALSTALAATPRARIAELAKRAGVSAVWIVDKQGRPERVYGGNAARGSTAARHV